MKIAYCIGSLGKIGGAERVLVNKANYLAEKEGYHVTIILAHQGDYPVLFNISPKIQITDAKINEIKSILFQIPLLGFFIKKNKLQKVYQDIIKRISPDVVINLERGFEDFILHQLNPKIPCIRESHSSLKAVEISDRSQKSSLKSRFYTYLYNKQLQQFDQVVLLTEEDKKYRNYKNGQIVIPNLVSKFTTDADYNIYAKKAISIGRLDKFKNFKDQIIVWNEVVKQFPDWELHIYGDGPDREFLNRLIGSKGLSNNVYLKGVSTSIEYELRQAAFFLFTSLAEGFGMVLVEAMQMGLPVISYNCPCGPKEIINDGVDGFLVKAGDLERLKEYILKLISNADLRQQMSKNAILKSTYYMEERIMPKWIKLFQEIAYDKN